MRSVRGQVPSHTRLHFICCDIKTNTHHFEKKINKNCVYKDGYSEISHRKLVLFKVLFRVQGNRGWLFSWLSALM